MAPSTPQTLHAIYEVLRSGKNFMTRDIAVEVMAGAIFLERREDNAAQLKMLEYLKNFVKPFTVDEHVYQVEVMQGMKSIGKTFLYNLDTYHGIQWDAKETDVHYFWSTNPNPEKWERLYRSWEKILRTIQHSLDLIIDRADYVRQKAEEEAGDGDGMNFVFIQGASAAPHASKDKKSHGKGAKGKAAAAAAAEAKRSDGKLTTKDLMSYNRQAAAKRSSEAVVLHQPDKIDGFKNLVTLITSFHQVKLNQKDDSEEEGEILETLPKTIDFGKKRIMEKEAEETQGADGDTVDGKEKTESKAAPGSRATASKSKKNKKKRK